MCCEFGLTFLVLHFWSFEWLFGWFVQSQLSTLFTFIKNAHLAMSFLNPRFLKSWDQAKFDFFIKINKHEMIKLINKIKRQNVMKRTYVSIINWESNEFYNRTNLSQILLFAKIQGHCNHPPQQTCLVNISCNWQRHHGLCPPKLAFLLRYLFQLLGHLEIQLSI